MHDLFTKTQCNLQLALLYSVRTSGLSLLRDG